MHSLECTVDAIQAIRQLYTSATTRVKQQHGETDLTNIGTVHWVETHMLRQQFSLHAITGYKLTAATDYLESLRCPKFGESLGLQNESKLQMW